MIESFALLFNDEDTTDATCATKNGKVYVHKAFVKMNSELLFEKITKEGEIKDIDWDILKFLYTGEIADYAEKAKLLIELAHSFQMPKLKAYCEETLIATLSVENVLERFIFASKNESPKLRMKTLALIQKENKNITSTKNWRNLAKENVDITLELVLECLHKKENGI